MTLFPTIPITGLKNDFGKGGVYLGLQCLFEAVEAILFDFIRVDQISSGYSRLKNGRCFLLYEH